MLITGIATQRCAWWLLALSVLATSARADEEAGNRAYVQASEWGAFYAKSIPATTYGTDGYTEVFRVVADGPDELLHRYAWYSPEVFLEGFLGTNDVYVAKLGPWARGHEARADHLAIAFFKNGKALTTYSTLDIAGTPANVSASVSHYQVFGKRLGFRRPFGNQLVFDIEDTSGATLSFDAHTGRRLAPGEETLMQQLDAARTAFQQLRWQWYERNKARRTDAGQHPITESELRGLSSDSFPSLPAGYRYRPGAVWDPVVLDRIGLRDPYSLSLDARRINWKCARFGSRREVEAGGGLAHGLGVAGERLRRT